MVRSIISHMFPGKLKDSGARNPPAKTQSWNLQENHARFVEDSSVFQSGTFSGSILVFPGVPVVDRAKKHHAWDIS